MKLETTPGTESFNGNVEETNRQGSSSNELITYVDETPFAVVESEDGFYVIMGKYRMSEAFRTSNEAIADAKKIGWMRILQVIGAVIENYNTKGNE